MPIFGPDTVVGRAISRAKQVLGRSGYVGAIGRGGYSGRTEVFGQFSGYEAGGYTAGVISHGQSHSTDIMPISNVGESYATVVYPMSNVGQKKRFR
jgi:hypothetical protein